MELEPKKLTGRTISIEPIGPEHLNGLIQAGRKPAIWEWMTFKLCDPAVVKRFIDHVSTMPEKGEGFGFAIRCNSSGSIIGGTGYWHIDHIHQKLEIGGSWITPKRQQTGANTETRYLMLCNAFENFNCKRVGFSVDTRNQKSIDAVTRIGAKKEGVLRSDMKLHNGRDRDSAFLASFSQNGPQQRVTLKRYF